MENIARRERPRSINRVDNVIGLFPGMVPNFSQQKTSMSLHVSAARAELASFETRLANLGIDLCVSDETLGEIVKADCDPKYGARAVQKTIEMVIEYPLSKAVLKGKFASKDTINVLWRDGVIAFEK